MDEKYKNAFDFLLYSYFGIEGEEALCVEKADVKVLCAHRAYLDLARTVDYKYSSSALNAKPKTETKEFRKKKDDAIKQICEYIVDEIGNYESNINFQNWHCRVCKTVIEKMGQDLLKENKLLTYGQAQKWLNMTLKYYWLLGLLPAAMKENDFDVPVDSYIIEAVWTDGFWNKSSFWESNDKRDKILKEDKIKKDASGDYKLNSFSDEKYISWSSWNQPEYRSFQKALKQYIGNVAPLKWEAKAWIEIAKKRANK